MKRGGDSPSSMHGAPAAVDEFSAGAINPAALDVADAMSPDQTRDL